MSQDLADTEDRFFQSTRRLNTIEEGIEDLELVDEDGPFLADYDSDYESADEDDGERNMEHIEVTGVESES